MDRWANGQWEPHIVGLPVNPFALEEGRGYFVRALRPVTWTNPGLTGTNRIVMIEPAPVSGDGAPTVP